MDNTNADNPELGKADDENEEEEKAKEEKEEEDMSTKQKMANAKEKPTKKEDICMRNAFCEAQRQNKVQPSNTRDYGNTGRNGI